MIFIILTVQIVLSLIFKKSAKDVIVDLLSIKSL